MKFAGGGRVTARMNKKDLTERDICTKFITPAVERAGWDVVSQIREEVYFTKGRIIVRGKLVTRGKAKFADYILYYKPNIPIALIEAKDNHHPVGGGMQQGLEYAATLDIPFVFSSNGDAFLFHDRTGQRGETETEIPLEAFPTPAPPLEFQTAQPTSSAEFAQPVQNSGAHGPFARAGSSSQPWWVEEPSGTSADRLCAVFADRR